MQWRRSRALPACRCIATNDVLYHAPERRELQDVVTCIREHVTLDDAGGRLETNAERHLKPPDEMAQLFRACARGDRRNDPLRRSHHFSLDQLKYNYPDEPVPKGKTAQQHLEDLTWEGAANRYPEAFPTRCSDAEERARA